MANPNETIKLIVDMGPSASNVKEVGKAVDDLGESVKRVKKPVDDLAEAADRQAAATKKGGQGILDVGRAIQDFAQGGVGGVLNNLEGLSRAFSSMKDAGGIAAVLASPAGMAGAITTIGTVAYVAWPHVRDFFKYLGEGSNKVPESANALKDLTEKMNENAKALKEMADKGKLTNDELKTFNERTAEQLRLEKEVEGERTRRKEAAAAAAVKPFEEAEGVKTREEAMTVLFGEPAARKEAVEGMAAEMMKAYHEAVKKGDPGRQVEIIDLMEQAVGVRGALRAPGEAAGAPFQRTAAAMLNRAMATGDLDAIRRMIQFLPVGRQRRDVMESALPENLERQRRELEEGEAQGQAAIEAGRRRRKAAAERAAEVEKMRVEGGADLVPGLGGLGAALPLGEAAKERAPAEAARRAREAEKAELEARERAAAAEIRRTEGVQMPPKEAFQELERRRRQRDQEQLDRNQELRTAEAIRQIGGPDYNYDPTAPLDQLRRENNQLKSQMSNFVRAAVEAAAGTREMVGDLQAGTQFFNGEARQMRQMRAPGLSGGHP